MILRFNHMFGDAHNRLYSTLALYSYAHSLVKRLIRTAKVSPADTHANLPRPNARPRQLTTGALLYVLGWTLRPVAKSRSEIVETVLYGDLLIDFRGGFDIHFPLVAYG